MKTNFMFCITCFELHRIHFFYFLINDTTVYNKLKLSKVGCLMDIFIQIIMFNTDLLAISICFLPFRTLFVKFKTII